MMQIHWVSMLLLDMRGGERVKGAGVNQWIRLILGLLEGAFSLVPETFGRRNECHLQNIMR